jgi:3-phosphoshikimate 1-carboxyvinyltransferase
MALPDPLPIRPFTSPARGTVELPGSKSLTNRALILAALCNGPVTLSGALFSEDTRIMAEALRRMGFAVEEAEAARTIRVDGGGGNVPATKADLFVGNAGTAARFLTALCASAPQGVFTIDGIPQMRTRPMKGLIAALRTLGADIRCTETEGFLPLEIHARGLRGGTVAIDASESSQMLSALLMVSPLARESVVIRLAAKVREPFVEITRKMMLDFGVDAGGGPSGFRIGTRGYFLKSAADGPDGSKTYAIEPDATAAGYFLALPLVVSGEVSLPGLTPGALQGDVAFAQALHRAGLAVSANPHFVARYDRGPRPGIDQDFRLFSDTFLTLAAIAPLLSGPTRISGIAHTRRQETDRVGNMARELRKLGQTVNETEDSLEIHPGPLPAGAEPATVDTHGDHRFAMSFGILGCRDLLGNGRPWLAIGDPGCCAKTFPHFFDLLETLRRGSSGEDGR